MKHGRGTFSSFATSMLLVLGCESKAIDAEPGATEPGATEPGAAGASGAAAPNPCSNALRLKLTLVDEQSTARVETLAQDGTELDVYADASAGGLNELDENPWLYVALASGTGVALGDLEALDSRDWDLALKRNVIRTNGGDSGPGQGGALRVLLDWDDVDESTLGSRELPVEDWFDDECNLTVDTSTGELITTFSGWSEYDEATHLLAPAEAVYLTQSADGSLYKVAILDYYAKPDGSHGTKDDAAHYLLRIAPLK